MIEPRFLTVAEVLVLHREAIARYGGSPGVREPGLLDSAVHTPQAAFGDRFLHETLADMAAAYLFHIVENHPFEDGNKRTGWLAMRMFLRLNGYRIKPRLKDSYKIVMRVAKGEIRNSRDVSKWISKRMKPL